MRKFFWVVAVGFLVLTVAAPAMALDFKFGAEYRFRTTIAADTSFDSDAPNSNPRSIQMRIRPRFDVSDDNGNITATLRLEIGDIEFGNGGGATGETNQAFSPSLSQGGARVGNGAGGALGVDGVNVETKWAYIDWAMPFNIPLRVRAGLQPWYLPKGMIMDDDAAGVRAYGTVKPVSYEAFWYRANGGPQNNAATSTGLTVCTAGGITFYTTSAAACTGVGGVAGATTSATSGTVTAVGTSNTKDNNYDFYGGKVDVAIAPFLNPGLYFVYGDNRNNCTNETAASTCVAPYDRFREAYWIGATATGKIGIVSYDLDFLYGFAEGGTAGNFGGAATPVDVKGWAVDGAVHFPIGPLTLNVAGSYATGDKRNGGDSETFPSIAASWNGPGGGFEMIGSGGVFDQIEFTQDSPANLWSIGAWVNYNLTKALALKAGVAYAGFVEKNGNCAVVSANACYGPSYAKMAGKDSLGTEVHVRADYEIWTGFKLQGQLGWLFPSTGDAASEYVVQMYYNF